MKERSFSVAFLDRTKVNMTSCFELEEEIDEEGANKETCLGEIDRTVATLEAMLICLNWGQIFSCPNETYQHMVIALQHPKIYVEKVKDVVGILETPIQCVSCNTDVAFTDDNLLLGSKPHNHPLFMVGYIKE